MDGHAPKKPAARKQSAGLLLYRSGPAGLQVLLVHPGGPFWRHKDLGAWSIPKGEIDAGEDELTAARREFREETGYRPKGKARDLDWAVQPGGKRVHVWAVEDDWDPARLISNTFDLEWPQHSGRITAFPEVDRAAWFSLDEARTKILRGQLPFLDRLELSLREKK